MTTEGRQRLLELFKSRAVFRGDFVLASGIRRPCYFDGRLVTLWPEGALLIGREILPLMLEAGVEAVGGMTTGADPIATSVALVSYQEGRPIPAFIVRADVKDHGTHKRIEGPLREGARVGIVDDVITSGGSVLRAIEAVEAEGCTVGKVVVLLDRYEGGSEEIRRRGYDLSALLIARPDSEVQLA